jgi:hypothetical protein
MKVKDVTSPREQKPYDSYNVVGSSVRWLRGGNEWGGSMHEKNKEKVTPTASA